MIGRGKKGNERRMRNKKLRVGFIGAGGIAQSQMKHFKAAEDVELVAASDISDKALAKTKELYGVPQLYTDWKEMLKKEALDAVSVCTPNGAHAENTIAALKAGCHVMVEKPMAMDAGEGQEMVNAAKKAGKQLIIGFQWRFHPKVQFFRQQAKNGAFGKILFMRCQAIRRRGIPNWGVFGRKELQGGGPMIDIGVHIMECAHYIMGEPKPVAASGNTFRYLGDKPSEVASMWPNWDYKTYTVEDLAVGQIRFDNGAIMQVEASFAAHAKDAWNFAFMGEKGGGELDPLAVRTDKNNWANTRFANGTPVTDTSYQVSMDSQISAVRQQRIALYETERAKGTPPAEIYDKLQAFNARLPNDYKSATGLLA
jgi:predicted dehydrogenase